MVQNHERLKKRICYATLGYTPSVLLGLRDQAAELSRITVFHGDLNRPQRRALEKAAVILEALGAPYRTVEVPQPWSIEACLRSLFREYEADGRPPRLLIHASGGTEVLNAAATILGLFARCRVQFVDRHTWRLHTLDFHLLQEAFRLEGTRRNLLEALLEHHGVMEVARLRRRLGVTPGAVSQVLRDLFERGLLRLEPRPHGRGKVAVIEPHLWGMLLFTQPRAHLPTALR